MQCKKTNFVGRVYPECRKGMEFCGVEECPSEDSICMTIYSKVEHETDFRPTHASCWKADYDKNCQDGKCVMKKNANMFQCCCKGDLCNGNIVFEKSSTTRKWFSKYFYSKSKA